MRAVTLVRLLTQASRGKVLTTEQALTLQWLRAEARVEAECLKRVAKRAVPTTTRWGKGSASPEGRAA